MFTVFCFLSTFYCLLSTVFYQDLEKTYVCELWTFGSADLAKKTFITTNFKNSANQIFNPKSLFFFSLTGAIWYYHAINIVLKFLQHLQAMNMTFLKLFLICYLWILLATFGYFWLFMDTFDYFRLIWDPSG